MSQLKTSIWRVPLISLVAGMLYSRCYVRLVLRFGVVEPGVIDETVSLIVSGVLLLAVLVLGWALLLRKQTRREIFISASVVVAYGLLLWVLQVLLGAVTGPAAVVFLHLGTPLEWTGFFAELSLYLHDRGVTIPFLGLLRYMVPWLFAAFGRPSSARLP
jgi:hypothetical protein